METETVHFAGEYLPQSDTHHCSRSRQERYVRTLNEPLGAFPLRRNFLLRGNLPSARDALRHQQCALPLPSARHRLHLRCDVGHSRRERIKHLPLVNVAYRTARSPERRTSHARIEHGERLAAKRLVEMFNRILVICVPSIALLPEPPVVRKHRMILVHCAISRNPLELRPVRCCTVTGLGRHFASGLTPVAFRMGRGARRMGADAHFRRGLHPDACRIFHRVSGAGFRRRVEQ